MNKDDSTELLMALVRRHPLLAVLADGPADKRTLEETFNVSRSTINRAIRELEEFGLLTRDETGYRTTTTGRLLTERYDDFEGTVSRAMAISDLLAHVPPDAPFDPLVLTDADVERATAPNPNRPVAEMVERAQAATRLRVLGKSLSYLPTVDAFHDRITADATVAGVFDPRLMDHFESAHPTVIEDAATRDDVELRKVESLPYSLVLIDTDDGAHGYLVVYESAGNFVGLIHNDTDAAIAWFEDVFESYWSTADPV